MGLELKELVYTSIFLSLCSLASMVQIPIWGFLTIEFSLIFLLLSRFYISFKYVVMIACIYPFIPLFFSTVPAEVIGQLMLLSQGIFFIIFDRIFNKEEMKWEGVVLNILFTTIISFVLNLFIFFPLWGVSFWKQGSTIKIIATISFLFNPIKLSIIYILFIPFLSKVKNIL